ncbi:hypothetical protein J2P12_00055 [Candidatus Bathyarchaeota archaeon]|nr:hypothetical protein [Candidatus Bathyarchaeota archaeon]
MCLPVKPYKVEREWKAFGFACAVVMGREAGSRCGYVRVPPSHPAHGKNYDDVDVSVHGGLTFAELEPCVEHEDGQGWWLGFDCAHSGDAMYDPSVKPEDVKDEKARAVLEIHRRYHSPETEHYWSESEAVAEAERLAEQLAVMK